MFLFFIGMSLSLAVVSCRHTVPDKSVVFGNIVTASNIDSNNAPTALADVFSPRQNTIMSSVSVISNALRLRKV